MSPPASLFPRCQPLFILLVVALLYSTLARAGSFPDATALVTRADARFRGETSMSHLLMRIERPGWSREVGLTSWTKGHDRSMILITNPARDRGTAFLLRDNEVWNWVPAVERVIKIPPSMMMQSWMGSDFTNDDLVRESSLVHDYSHEVVGDTLLAGRDSWKLELFPLPEAPVVWGRIDLWISKQDDLQLMARYFDEDGFLVNTLVLSEIRLLDDRLLPTRLEMRPADEPDHLTVLIYEEAEFNRPLEDSFFGEQRMKALR